MFRQARADDFEAVLRLYRQLHRGDPVLEDGSDWRAFELILSSPGLCLFVLENEDAVVATAYLNVIPNISRSASPYGIIENVVVEESLRRRGLGKLLVGRTLEAAWRAGCYKVMLSTGSKNPATHAFYEACGFSGSERTAYVARPI